MDSIIIKLKYDRKVFEEAFGKYKEFDFILWPKLRITNLIAIASIIFFLIVILNRFPDTFSQISKGRFLFFLLIASIFLSMIFYDRFQKYKRITQYREEVKNHLDQLDKISENKLILSEETFSLLQDENELNEKWMDFKNIVIEEDFIALNSALNSFLIPSQSISSEDLALLKSVLLQKTQAKYFYRRRLHYIFLSNVIKD